MKYYQNTLTGEVVSEDEYSYAAAQKGNWVLYPKIPRYTIETPPYSPGRAEFDEDGKFCYWDDVKDIVIHAWCGPWPHKKEGELRKRAGRKFWDMIKRFEAEPNRELFRVGGGCIRL